MVTTALDIETWIKEEAAAWASGDVEKILPFYTDSCVYEDLALNKVNHGKEELRGFITDAFAAFHDLSTEVRSFFSSGNRVCIEFVLSGTHKGDLPGLPATGKAFAIRGVHVCEMKGNKATRVSDYWDMASLQRQLGLLPSIPEK